MSYRDLHSRDSAGALYFLGSLYPRVRPGYEARARDYPLVSDPGAVYTPEMRAADDAVFGPIVLATDAEAEACHE